MSKRAKIGDIRNWSGVDYVKVKTETGTDWERVDSQKGEKEIVKKSISLKRDLSEATILKMDELTYRFSKIGDCSIVETI